MSLSGERRNGKKEKKVPPLNEISPPPFPIRALHPLFIQFNEIVVWRVSEFWKSFHSVFKNLVINPVRESNDEHFESCR